MRYERAWRERNPELAKLRAAEKYQRTGKNRMLKKLYGITLEHYNNLLTDQQNSCKICLKEVKLFVDHCHATKKVRGLLCSKCNFAIGLMDDSPERLEAAAMYLRR